MDVGEGVGEGVAEGRGGGGQEGMAVSPVLLIRRPIRS